jgi:hypothetical protein
MSKPDSHNTYLIIELLKKDLSAPRVLLEQVSNYLNDRFEAPSERLEWFFQEKFPQLEDYEVDLAFSPQYTPAWSNRLEYAPVLGADSLSEAAIQDIKRQLLDAKLTTRFKALNSEAEVQAPVHEVFIDRYVNLLKLDQPVPSVLHAAILSLTPETSHPEMILLAREDVWQSESRQQILVAFLKVFQARHTFSTEKVSFLTSFIRTYRPESLLDLDRQFDSLVDSCRKDMENVAGRGFHDEYLKALNAGNLLSKNSERGVWDHYHQMIDHAQALKLDLQDIPKPAQELSV